MLSYQDYNSDHDLHKIIDLENWIMASDFADEGMRVVFAFGTCVAFFKQFRDSTRVTGLYHIVGPFWNFWDMLLGVAVTQVEDEKNRLGLNLDDTKNWNRASWFVNGGILGGSTIISLLSKHVHVLAGTLGGAAGAFGFAAAMWYSQIKSCVDLHSAMSRRDPLVMINELIMQAENAQQKIEELEESKGKLFSQLKTIDREIDNLKKLNKEIADLKNKGEIDKDQRDKLEKLLALRKQIYLLESDIKQCEEMLNQSRRKALALYRVRNLDDNALENLGYNSKQIKQFQALKTDESLNGRLSQLNFEHIDDNSSLEDL